MFVSWWEMRKVHEQISKGSNLHYLCLTLIPNTFEFGCTLLCSDALAFGFWFWMMHLNFGWCIQTKNMHQHFCFLNASWYIPMRASWNVFVAELLIQCRNLFDAKFNINLGPEMHLLNLDADEPRMHFSATGMHWRFGDGLPDWHLWPRLILRNFMAFSAVGEFGGQKPILASLSIEAVQDVSLQIDPRQHVEIR
jgi:hypothetical protein